MQSAAHIANCLLQFIVAHWPQAFMGVTTDASQIMGGEASASACDALSIAEVASPCDVASMPVPESFPAGGLVVSEEHACAPTTVVERQMHHQTHRHLMQPHSLTRKGKALR